MVEEEKNKVIAQIKEELKLKGKSQRAICRDMDISHIHFGAVLNRKKPCTLDTYYKYLNFIKNNTK